MIKELPNAGFRVLLTQKGVTFKNKLSRKLYKEKQCTNSFACCLVLSTHLCDANGKIIYITRCSSCLQRKIKEAPREKHNAILKVAIDSLLKKGLIKVLETQK